MWKSNPSEEKLGKRGAGVGVFFIIEKSPIFRSALCTLLNNMSLSTKMVEMGSVRDFEKGVKKYDVPTLITLDLHLDDSLGVSGINAIRRHYDDVPIILFHNEVSERIQESLLEAGATLCIDKSSSLQHVRDEMSKIIGSNKVDNPDAPTLSEIRLTRRHRQLLLMLGRGMSNEEIASELNLSINTVKIHMYRLYKRMETKSRIQTVAKARELGWIL